jgi:hypothetical protein
MIAARNDIVIEQGATFLMTLIFSQQDGTPIDLTGYAGRMQIRETVGGRVLVSLTEGLGVRTNQNPGQVEVRIPATVTRNLAFKSVEQGQYDLFIENGVTGDALRLAEGGVDIIPAITK